jgi:hypothetical protein
VRRTLICADFVVTPETTEGPRAHKAQISLTIRADWHIVVRNPPCFGHDLFILNHVRRSRLLRENRSLHARWNILATINALDRARPLSVRHRGDSWRQRRRLSDRERRSRKSSARNWLVPWRPGHRITVARTPRRAGVGSAVDQVGDHLRACAADSAVSRRSSWPAFRRLARGQRATACASRIAMRSVCCPRPTPNVSSAKFRPLTVTAATSSGCGSKFCGEALRRVMHREHVDLIDTY